MPPNRFSRGPGPAQEPIYETHQHAPKRCPYPKCGELGRRKRTRTRTVRHLAHKRLAFWKVLTGVYAAACTCFLDLLKNRFSS